MPRAFLWQLVAVGSADWICDRFNVEQSYALCSSRTIETFYGDEDRRVAEATGTRLDPLKALGHSASTTVSLISSEELSVSAIGAAQVYALPMNGLR